VHRFVVLFLLLFPVSEYSLAGARLDEDSGAFLSIDQNIRIRYQRAGKGAPMLLVPGWSFSGAIFSKQIPHFSRTYDVIAIDPRGQGESTKSPEGNSYRQHGADIAALVDQLRLNRVIFLGWSWGCYDILSYVRQFGPAQVDSFICLDEPPRGWSSQPNEWAGLHSLETFAGLYHAVADHRKAFTDEFVTSTVTRPLTGQELESLVAMSLTTPDHVALALAADGMMSDYSEEAILLAKSVPTLYILREEAQVSAAPWMAEHMPDTRTIYKAGHLMFWEFPDEINAAIDEFLSHRH